MVFRQKFTYDGRTIYTHNHILKNFEGADGLKTGFTNASGYNIITSAERDGHRVIAVTMGHNTARERDRKVAQMMNKGLSKLALNDKVNTSSMYAKLEEKTSAPNRNKNLLRWKEPQRMPSSGTFRSALFQITPKRATMRLR